MENKNPNPEPVDLSLLEYTLSLSYEERLLQHERTRQIIGELQKARKAIYGEPEQSPESAS